MENRSVKPEKQLHCLGQNIRKVFYHIGHIRHLHWIIGIAASLVFLIVLMPHSICANLWVAIKSQKTLVIMILTFGLVAVSLVWSTGQSIDVWIFKHFNTHGWHAPWFDGLMFWITQLGSGVFGIITALIIFISGNRFLAYQMALGTLTLWLTVELLKVLIQRTRPYLKLNKIRTIGTRARGYSFPSGHTSQAFFMAALLAHYYQASIWMVISLYGVALLVGFTRIYVGMHYPRDVLGGTILGTMWGIFGVIINNYIWYLLE